MKKIKICVVIGTAMNLNSLYKDQFKFLMRNGFEITGIAPPGIEHDWLNDDGIKTKVIKIRRTPSLFYDLYSLAKLFFFFVFNRFDIISVSTPKASLLGTLAACLSFHRNINYTLRGRAYENTTGVRRFVFEKIEQFICFSSKNVFCISHELKADFIRKGLCDPKKIFVIGKGSSNGVDLNLFSKNPTNTEAGERIRAALSLKPTDVLLLNSGRLRKDKGINELVLAFRELLKSHDNLYLLLQGTFEEFDPLDVEVMNEIEKNPKIFVHEWSKTIDSYLVACDIFVFPTHREGFGNVAIEASAMEVPVVAFDVIGCRESVKDGISGVLCGDISVENLVQGLKPLVTDTAYRLKLGETGRKWVVENFQSEYIWKELLKVYRRMVSQ